MKTIHSILLCTTILVSFTFCTKKENDTPVIPPTNLTISTTENNFTTIGGTIDVNVTSNAKWSVTDTSLWLTTIADSANGKFTITVDKNLKTAERISFIKITAGDSAKSLKIIQSGNYFNFVEVGHDSITPDQTDIRNLTSLELSKLMKVGWNAGNSLDAIGGETAWGNPKITKQLIDSIKKAGFNTVRIPVAWSNFSIDATYTIKSAWIARVKEVVKYVTDNDMYAIINIHWDNGWMQPTAAKQEYVNNRLEVMWHQIAVNFRDCNDHVLFAGTNEVCVTGVYSAPTVEQYSVQNGFNQIFVKAVRATGGKNHYRHLIVQGFNTNIDYTFKFLTIPTDVIKDRLMVEIHYYDPYNYTLSENNNITQWGKLATEASKTETWANESYADIQFQKLKIKFIDKGYPVIMGEYGVIARTNLGSTDLNNQYTTNRCYYLNCITKSALRYGIVPIIWDNGGTGNFAMGLFNRSNGSKAYPAEINAIVSAIAK